MQPSPFEAKAALREQMRIRLRALAANQRAADSAAARALLLAQTTWREAGSVLFYAPLPTELDLWPLVGTAIQAGKRVALPRFVPEANRYEPRQVCSLERDLAVGRYGIREPTASCELMAINQLDLLLVPGVAFDLHGRRLGRGRGYYDQLLADVRGKSCGVAFDQQVVREIPVLPHDALVNCILTPTRWMALGPRTALE